MYKKSFLSLMVMLLFVATSCSSEEPAAIESGGTISGDAGKTLIVYFSWGGNTRTVANHIHDLIGGDIVEVETVVPYPDTYEEVTQIAPGELESDYRPELKTKVENMDEYDTLIVGTPIWGGHLTPAMKSFLAGYDLSGKPSPRSARMEAVVRLKASAISVRYAPIRQYSEVWPYMAVGRKIHVAMWRNGSNKQAFLKTTDIESFN